MQQELKENKDYLLTLQHENIELNYQLERCKEMHKNELIEQSNKLKKDYDLKIEQLNNKILEIENNNNSNKGQQVFYKFNINM